MRLTNEQVLEIFKSEGTNSDIASRYDVHPDTVRRIRLGESHSDLTSRDGDKPARRNKYGYSGKTYERHVAATKRADDRPIPVRNIYETLWGGMFAWKVNEPQPVKKIRGGY